MAAALCASIALVFVVATAASLPDAAASTRLGVLRRVAPDHFRLSQLPRGDTSGARAGDILDTRALTVEQRARFWNAESRAGAKIRITLFRNGKPITVDATMPARDAQTQVADDISLALLCFGVVAGLLLMFRGRGKTSFTAGLMLLTLGITLAPVGAWVTPVWLSVALFELMLWCEPAFAVCAFALGMFLLGESVSRSVRILLIVAASVAIASETFVWSLDYGLWMFTGHTEGGQLVYPYAATAWISVTILTFALAAARTQGGDAAAVRTLFVATLIGLGEIACTYLAGFGLLPSPPPLLSAICQLVLFVGYFYAFFARHLVALDFVISRAAVFTILAGVIAGVLALVEKFVEAFALGRESIFAVELGATLLIALSFRWLEHRISAAVEHVFYRNKLRAAEALDALTDDFPFHRDRTALANHLVREVFRRLQVPSVVLYFAKGHEYVAEGAAGSELLSFPPIADTDPAILRLRSKHRAIDCHDFQTQLGSSGYAFPLEVLGRAIGCLYVAARANGEGLDPDEHALLTRLAREAATALLWMTEQKTATADEAYST